MIRALRAHPIALGGAPLGNLYRALTDADAHALVRHAWQSGIRYFDTAPHYGHGLSERRMGAVLSELPRDTFVLSTKVGRLLKPDAAAPSAQHGYVDVPSFVQSYDYTRDGVLRSLDDSLRRLRLERADLVYVHDLDRATHGPGFDAHFRALLEGGLPALADLKRAGTIGGYGIGVNGVDICMETLRHADLDAILLAGRYTLADQTALPALLPECLRRNVAVVLGGPFNSGILATGAHPADGQVAYFDYAPAPAGVVARVDAIEAVARRFAVPLPAAALQFPAAHPAIGVVLAGARSVRELDEILAWSRHPVPTGFWVELRSRGLVAESAPLPAAGLPH
ncbi:MAG: aldo/keto reductase [Burkholderiales bacterium]